MGCQESFFIQKDLALAGLGTRVVNGRILQISIREFDSHPSLAKSRIWTILYYTPLYVGFKSQTNVETVLPVVKETEKENKGTE